MKQEMTPWFLHATAPVHVGVYQVDAEWHWARNRNLYSYWDGRQFNWVTGDAYSASLQRTEKGAGGLVKFWRGLAKKP